MHNYILQEMIDGLVAKKVLLKKDRCNAVKIFEKYWQDKIAIVWCIDDIIEYAKGEGKKITRKKAGEILQAVYDDHDCNYGVTWQTIGEYTDNLCNGIKE